jgi:hypothetical protein
LLKGLFVEGETLLSEGLTVNDRVSANRVPPIARTSWGKTGWAFLFVCLIVSTDFLKKYAAPPLPFFTVSLIESALENSLYRGITVKKFGDAEN